jgi:hypothetical protein
MKHALTLLILSATLAVAQTNRTVIVNTNGTVIRPTNFVDVNFVQSVRFTPKRQPASFLNSITQTNAGTVEVQGNFVALALSTNANALAAIRATKFVDNLLYAGGGTQFAIRGHELWFDVEILPRAGSLVAQVGNNSYGTTNVGSQLSSHGFGVEIAGTLTNDNVKVRLIAHNGTNYHTGSYVEIGSLYNRFTIGAKRQTNGVVQLFVGTQFGLPTERTNATITNGPTQSAANQMAAFDFRMFSSSTNSSSSGAQIFDPTIIIK